MNSERKAFEEWHKKEYVDKLEWDSKKNEYKDFIDEAMWEAWQASAKRQGHKLVPVDVLERAISHISIAMCHPNNTRNEEDIMHNDMVIIEEAMIGAVDNDH